MTNSGGINAETVKESMHKLNNTIGGHNRHARSTTADAKADVADVG